MKKVCVVIMLSLLVNQAMGQGAVDRKSRGRTPVPKSEAQRQVDAALKAKTEAEAAAAKASLTAAQKKLTDAVEALRAIELKVKSIPKGTTSKTEDSDAMAAAMKEVQALASEVSTAVKSTDEAEKKVAEATKVAASAESDTGKRIDNNYLSINSGLYLLNPYEIGASNRLERGDSEAAFFIEFAFNNAWAWNPARRQYTWSDRSCDFFDFKSPLDHMDFQTKLSFFLHDNGSKTTNASTIVGSGDFAAEATVTFNIYQGLFGPSPRATGGADRSIFDETTLAQSIGVVVSYGGITDRQAFDIHHRIFTGLGYKGAFRIGESDPESVARELLYNIQMGYAWIEQTQFLNDDTREIKLTQGDLPDYQLEGGFAVETELYWRITKTSFLFVGARLYANHDPNPWSAHIGVTIAADKVSDLLGL